MMTLLTFLAGLIIGNFLGHWLVDHWSFLARHLVCPLIGHRWTYVECGRLVPVEEDGLKGMDDIGPGWRCNRCWHDDPREVTP